MSNLKFFWMICLVLALLSNTYEPVEGIIPVWILIIPALVGIAGKVGQQLAVGTGEKAVSVTNRAHDWFRIWCASKDDSIGEKHLHPGQTMAFKFRPRPAKSTVFWCTLDYKTYWARFDVFGVHASYGFSNGNHKTFDYEVRDDGVYYRGKKIRGLRGGQHSYTLWEHYDGNKNPFGASLKGFVDGGMCNNIPGWMNRKTSSVTVCNHNCVILHKDLHCRGETSRLQAGNGCSNFWLSYFNDKASSVKGC